MPASRQSKHGSASLKFQKVPLREFSEANVRVGSKREELSAEQMSSGLPSKADIARCSRHVSKVPLHEVAAQHSCQNAKVVEAFCHAACRISNQCRPSTHQPTVDEFRMPAEMSIALSRANLHAHMHVASCRRRVHHRDRHQHTIPIALAALPGAILPATSCIGAFRTPAAVARG